MVDRLSNLISIFDTPGLDFSGNRAEGDDILGDAYEYLMRHFATESGKSKGQFYTPAEVSRIMAKVIGVGDANSPDQTIYDPTCGSGSLLLKAHDEAKHGARRLDLAIYGQEMDNATSALAKMNMILHDCTAAVHDIYKDNTLSTPRLKQPNGALKTFDFVVANPPFSTKAWSNGFDPANDEFGRFEYGIPPEKNGDYAFLLHILTSLKSTGKGAVILPHGVLFRGGAEGAIRKRIVEQGYIKGIIGLPANLFFGTGIPACIIVLDKAHSAVRKGIFMIDASRGFAKDGNKNRLREQDIHKIVDTFINEIECDKYSKRASLADIEANDFNLNLPRYIDASEPEDLQDIEAHLKGGIPNADIDALDAYWQVFPNLKAALFAPDRAGYSRSRNTASEIRPVIFQHPEFVVFQSQVNDHFNAWADMACIHLKAIVIGSHPKTLINTISEAILRQFEPAPLIDAYDVYQHLMSYWAETMQDDAYMVASDGWQAWTNGQPNTDLLPDALLVARYFQTEVAHIEVLEAKRDAISRELEALMEEHGGEDGLLEEAKTDKGRFTLKSMKDWTKAMQREMNANPDLAELAIRVLLVLNDEAEASRAVKTAQTLLATQVKAKYQALTELEVMDLLVNDKWLATLRADAQSELDRVSQALAGRVKQLAERYSTPLPQLMNEVDALSARVDEHLKTMGFVWG
ncbi:type I restriction-modification system subunit M [Andreprevotia chitinilytica]|uniref:type I restriction-modification system subunit M n=1 Tax=Andreprevotia chitinilytica TaxID=396808 RepID=UPI000AC24602|nr:type I restriction-modification system subunit M [Andreprevotia chitinilytica]